MTPQPVTDRLTINESITPKAIVSAFRQERALFWTGVAGITIGIFLLAFIAINGKHRPPEGDLFKAATFDIAVGIYILNLTLFLPFAAFTNKARRRWRWTTIAFVLYGYTVETVQILRGLDPRFSRVGGPVDQILGLVFLLIALGLIVLFVILVRHFFVGRNPDQGTLFMLGLRYGSAAALLALLIGVWMSANGGPQIGARGNLLPLHAAGFHGLQAIPLVALLFEWARAPKELGRKWVHVAGIAWLLACTALSVQIASGRSVLDAAYPTIVAGLMFAIWAMSFTRSVLAWHASRGGLQSSADAVV